MVDSPAQDTTAVFAKTTLGLEEIQQRTLRLPLLTRRVLLLVDGRRSVAELATLAGNADVASLLADLQERGCIERVAAAPAPSPRAAPSRAAAPSPAPSPAPAPERPSAGAAADPALAGLPPPSSRSAEQIDMARHFMINTINRMLEQNSRLTLVEKIFSAPDAAALREQFPHWEEAISSSWMGKRRLPDLRKKLFEVL